MNNYKVTEDKAGVLVFWMFDKGNRPICAYFNINGEQIKGLICLLDSNGEFYECEYGSDEGIEEKWEEIENIPYNDQDRSTKIIASRDFIYPENMGASGRLAFGIDDDYFINNPQLPGMYIS